jgi:hypothetical protein
MKSLLTILAISILSATAYGFGNNNIKLKKGAKKTIIKRKSLPKNAALSFGVFNAGITMPTKILNGTPHVGVEIGYSVPIKKDAKKQRLTVGADGGYFFQKGLQSATYIKPNIALKVPISKKVNVQARVGAGVMLTKNQNNEFAQNENGVYQKVSPYNTQFMGSVGIQPNFNVYNSKHFKYDAYVRYEFAMQTPFSAISSLLPITMFNLGVKVENK